MAARQPDMELHKIARVLPHLTGQFHTWRRTFTQELRLKYYKVRFSKELQEIETLKKQIQEEGDKPDSLLPKRLSDAYERFIKEKNAFMTTPNGVKTEEAITNLSYNEAMLLQEELSEGGDTDKEAAEKERELVESLLEILDSRITHNKMWHEFMQSNSESTIKKEVIIAGYLESLSLSETMKSRLLGHFEENMKDYTVLKQKLMEKFDHPKFLEHFCEYVYTRFRQNQNASLPQFYNNPVLECYYLKQLLDLLIPKLHPLYLKYLERYTDTQQIRLKTFDHITQSILLAYDKIDQGNRDYIRTIGKRLIAVTQYFIKHSPFFPKNFNREIVNYGSTSNKGAL